MTLGPMINRQHTGHAPPRAMVAPMLRSMLAAGRNNATLPTGLHFPTLAPSDTPRLRQMRSVRALPCRLHSCPKKQITPIVLVSRGGFRLPPRTPRPRRGGILWPFRGWPRSIQRRVRGGGRARPQRLRDLVLGRQSRSRRAQRRRALDGQSYVRAIRGYRRRR
jgi:hypothetical protein